MKVKKLLSIVTAMAMLLGMMSFTTFAAGEVMVSDAAGLIEAAKTGGDITLEDDITLTEPLVLEASTVLDLNGHSITSTAAGAYDSAIRMKNSSDALTIKDSGNGGSISGVGEYLINDGAVTIEGGNLMLNPSDNVTAAAYGVYATAGFSMTGGSIEVNFLQANRLAYGVSSRGGSVTITGDASIKASATSGTISLEATGDTTKGYTALISGNASLQGRVALSSFPTATFEGDISIVVPSCSSGDYTYAIQLSRTNCTINGGYFEAQDRHFFSAGGGSEIVNQNDFIINDGTFYLNSTDSWTVGTFYDYVPVINGGVFKTDTDALYFAASWSVYKNIQFNGGYFEKPFKASSTADANTPKAICPTGYGFSTDTLAALTGNTSEYADYYWITKTSQIEANVNNSDVTDNNSVTTTVTGYTTYAEGSMSATSGGDSYTFYSDAAPYREGYTFRGWATSDTAMTGDQQLSGLTSADWTVYAVWEDGESTYDIVYDANGGSGTAPTTESEKETSEEITIPSGDSLNKANYIFAGWAIEPEATAATYSADDTVSVASIAKYAKLQDDKQVVTLYAVWESKVVIPEDTFSDQYYDYTGSPIAYVLEPVSINGETLEDFQITYYRDSSCTEELEEPPTDVGNYYGIMITRPEDDTYASFSQIVYLNIRGKRIRVSSSDYTGT